MRDLVARLPGSLIREVANAGIGRTDVLAFWFGEGDEPTAPEIRQAAIDSLERGETFYSHNLGLAELRDALRGYTAAPHYFLNVPTLLERVRRGVEENITKRGGIAKAIFARASAAWARGESR